VPFETTEQVSDQEGTVVSGRHYQTSVTLLLGYTNNDQLGDDAIARKKSTL